MARACPAIRIVRHSGEDTNTWQLVLLSEATTTALLKGSCCAGHIIAEGAGALGDLPSTVQSADWAFRIDPQDGWGPRSGKQAATAGWLASLPVFEPHWQVLSPFPVNHPGILNWFTHCWQCVDQLRCESLDQLCLG